MITLAEPGTKEISFTKNTDTELLLSADDLSSLFILEDDSKCPLEQF